MRKPELGSIENILMNYGCSRPFIDKILDMEATLAEIAKLPDELMNIKGAVDEEERAYNSGMHNAGYALKAIIK